MVRWIWILAGLLSVALGVIGALLPLLPTVPLMLLATFCFARSSERLHSWIVFHPRFGPPIADWREYGAIRRPAKVLATASVGMVFGGSALFGVSSTILVIQALVLTGVLAFIWSRPNV